MPEVIIGGNTYDVYVTVAEADVYLAGQISAATWRASDADTKAVAIISATRIIDRALWQGEPNDTYGFHAWPRSGLFYPDGRVVDPNVVPPEVVSACCELASALLDGSTVQDSTSPTESLISSLSAGSVSISYFRSDQGLGVRFPLSVMELIGFWLGSATTGTFGARSFGTCGKDELSDEHKFNDGV